MTTTGTLHAHPSDSLVILLKVPVDLNAEMGRFAPARFDLSMRAYLLLEEHLDSLRRFAKSIGLHLIDQRQAPPGDKLLMPECRHCGQPARLTAQPNRCPFCGKAWEPDFIDGRANERDPLTKACVRCGHAQVRSFTYCGQCGEVMPPDPDVPVRRIIASGARLSDPMALSDVMREAVEEMDGPTSAEWAALVKLEIRPCKAPDRQRMTATEGTP